MENNKLLKCFVIMPFSKSSDIHTDEHWNNHFTDFLKPLIEESLVFKAVRSEILRGDILRQIVTDLVTTPLVVADLTDANPNVYWELGVRQSFKHSTITIAEHGTTLPFDLTTKGTLFYYPNAYIKMEKFKKLFFKAIKDCHENPGSPDSYVLEAISGRETLYQILMRDESLRRLDALIAEIQNNQAAWKKIIEFCAVNIKKRDGSLKGNLSYSTDILRQCCIELLVASRYVSGSLRFYQKAESYLDNIMSVNERLPHWPARGESIDTWLNKRDEPVSKGIKEFQKLVEQQKNALDIIL